ncbi:MAG: SPFH domain-containing protein [Phycisphaerales bacterium]
MTIGFLLVGVVLAILIVTGTMKLPGAAVKAAGGVVALLVLLASFALSSFRLVGENQIGVVIRNIGGGGLAPGKIIATEGEMGPQAKILPPGWHPWLWPVIYDIETPYLIEVKIGEVALLTAVDGLALPAGAIYAPEWEAADLKKMAEDAEFFLTAGKGHKGPQASVLTPGKYRINPKLFTTEIVKVTNVKKATVGVVKSNVGEVLSGEAETPDVVVEKGHRGIWRQPLLPQEYYLNTKAYEVTMISTAKWVISYTGRGTGAEQREIPVRTSDGFDFPVDVRVEYEIKPVDAPLVVALFEDDKEKLLERLNSAVRAIFRNNAETVKALDYVQQRSQQESQSLVMLAEEMAKVGVTVTAVRIAGVAEDGSLDTLLKTQTDRQIADEEVRTFQQQQLAAEQEKELTRTKQEAEEEKRLATARYEVQIAEQDKEKRIIAAGAEAEAIRIKAEAQAEAYRVIALQIGSGNAALLELLKIVGESGINITPRVMVVGGTNGAGGNTSQSAETTALIGTMLDSMLSREGAAGDGD